MLETIEINPPGPAKTTIIWLHGLGADATDFTPIVPSLAPGSESGLRFVFPNAPYRPVTINMGLTMRAWYDITSEQINREEDIKGIRESETAVNGLIEKEIDSGISSEHIILAGFSQGGAIALHTGLRYPLPLGGILALSCYLPLIDSVADEANDINNKIPIMMAHGTFDPIVPCDTGLQSSLFLKQLGYPVEWHSYAMFHSVCDSEIADISSWLSRRF